MARNIDDFLTETEHGVLDHTGVPGAGGITARANGGAVVGPVRPQINVIQGSNVTVAVADDVPNNRINITISASAPSALTGGNAWNGSIGATSSFNFGGPAFNVGICSSTHGGANILSVWTASTPFGGSQQAALTWNLTSNAISGHLSGSIHLPSAVGGASSASVSSGPGFLMSNSMAVTLGYTFLSLNY
jgi:hypothetical protein